MPGTVPYGTVPGMVSLEAQEEDVRGLIPHVGETTPDATEDNEDHSWFTVPTPPGE